MITKTSPNASYVREEQVVQSLTRFLSEAGYRVRHEVPNMGQSADMVATKGRWVTFIEAKTKDWRKALVQCRAHEQVADFVCVALLTRMPPTRLLQELSGTGYGLLLVSPKDGSCRWVTPAQRNKTVWIPQRRRLSVALRKINYAD